MQEYEESTGGESRSDSALRLEERAYAVDALQQAEREWIVASTSDWQATIDADAHHDDASAPAAGEESVDQRERGDLGDRSDGDEQADATGGAPAPMEGGDHQDSPGLDAIPELSAAHVRVLSRAGIDTIPALVAADVETLADLTGYDRALLRHWQAIARIRL